MEKLKAPRPLTRDEIIKGFHQLYFKNISAATQKNGRRGGIDGTRLKEIFNETIADYYEQLLAANYLFPLAPTGSA